MPSTCTSRTGSVNAEQGFTLIELLVGLALALTVTMSVAPSWLSLEEAGARETDRTVASLQGRVAVARLERDLRLASAAGCLFSVSSPVLEASSSQVVFLKRSGEDTAPTLVEWEIANGTLMRRWGVCPSVGPSVYSDALYLDHKTMLESVRPGSKFAYVIDGMPAAAPISEEDLAAIDAVVLDVRTAPEGEGAVVEVSTTARVAR